MTHPSNEEWMAYLYSEVDRRKKAELKEHLKRCTECQADVNNWQNVMGELDKWQLPKRRRASAPAPMVGSVRAARKILSHAPEDCRAVVRRGVGSRVRLPSLTHDQGIGTVAKKAGALVAAGA